MVVHVSRSFFNQVWPFSLCLSFAAKKPRMSALIELFKHPFTGEFSSTRYLKAGGEVLAILMVSSWIVTYFYNPDAIASNPLKRRLGYNNFCVGFDTLPARYVAQFLWPLTSYFSIRFAWLETVTELSLDAKYSSCMAKFLTAAGCGLFVVSSLAQPFLLVFPPAEENGGVYVHTVFFIQYVLVRLFVIAVQFFRNSCDGSTDDANHITTGQWRWFYVYTISSIAFPAMVFADYIYFDFYKPATAPEEQILIPWYICNAMDLSWFACLGLSTRFLPNQRSFRADVFNKNVQAAAKI